MEPSRLPEHFNMELPPKAGLPYLHDSPTEGVRGNRVTIYACRTEFTPGRQPGLCYPSSVVKRDANRPLPLRTVRRMVAGVLLTLRRPSRRAEQFLR